MPEDNYSLLDFSYLYLGYWIRLKTGKRISCQRPAVQHSWIDEYVQSDFVC